MSEATGKSIIAIGPRLVGAEDVLRVVEDSRGGVGLSIGMVLHGEHPGVARSRLPACSVPTFCLLRNWPLGAFPPERARVARAMRIANGRRSKSRH